MLVAGSVLENRYRIEEMLGQGGMGAIYRAYDNRLHKLVAIKENTLAALGISPEAMGAARAQFEREALMLASLRHANLPNVIDHFVTPDGSSQYLVMDYIEGEDLAQIVSRTGPLPEKQAVAWVVQVCGALDYLHSRQPPIIHRDIKPQNIKVTPEGQVFLVDFGLAKVGASSKTMTGALGVTPGFSPPEQYKIGGTDERSDVYGLGATLYALLTGQMPPESLSLLDGTAGRSAIPRTMPAVHFAMMVRQSIAVGALVFGYVWRPPSFVLLTYSELDQHSLARRTLLSSS